MPQIWRALCFDIDAERLTPQTRHEGASGPVGKDTVPSRMAIYVVSHDDAAIAAMSVPGLEGRRPQVKDRRKGLAIYLAPGSPAVRVSAPYRDPGQAERGIRDLARSRAGRRWRGIYLLEIDTKLFDQLWTRAAFALPHGAGARAWPDAQQAPSASGERGEGGGEEVGVPESLKKAFVGDSPEAGDVRRRIVMASRTEHPVLIIGETGTGKEIVARQIHELGRRRHERFITVNCAAIAHDLLESELFGHVEGAFTGATSDKAGLYEVAQNGTLFLDEVGDLHPAHQAKVLRMLNDGDYRPVGSPRSRKGNARIIAATNRNLPRSVEEREFRDDLWYRLLSFVIETPALRSHPGDIPTIAEFLWPAVTDGTDCAALLSGQVLDMLKGYPWQGNVRELRAFLANLSTLAGPRPLTTALVTRAFRAWTRVTTHGED